MLDKDRYGVLDLADGAVGVLFPHTLPYCLPMVFLLVRNEDVGFCGDFGF